MTSREGTLRPDASVAIVGAGPSGVFTAMELQRLGYERVALFDGNAHVGGIAQAAELPEMRVDHSVTLVPPIGLDHPGVNPPLKALLDECEIELRPYGEPRFFDPDTGKVGRLPPVVADYSQVVLLGEIVRGFGLLYAMKDAEGVAGLIDAGIVRPGETLAEWGERNDVAGFTRLMAYFFDAFGYAPSADRPAGYLLRSRPFFQGPLFESVFHQRKLLGLLARLYNGVRGLRHGRAVAAPLRRFLALPPSNASYYYCRESYHQLFERLAARRGLDVRLETPVAAVRRRAGGGLALALPEGEHACDAVVFACPVRCVGDLLREAFPERAATFTFPPEAERIRSWVVRFARWPEAWPERAIMFTSRNDAGLGLAGARRDGRVYAISRVEPAGEVGFTLTYLPAGMSLEESERILREDLAGWGVEVAGIADSRIIPATDQPPREAVAAGWYDAVRALQGRDGTYFVSEALAGTGIPTILDYVRRVVPRYFPSNQA